MYRGVPRKKRSENMQQIYRRTSMPKCDFNKVTLQVYRRTPKPKCDFNKVAKQLGLRHGCYSVNVLHIFRITFFRNTSGWLLLKENNKGLRKVK